MQVQATRISDQSAVKHRSLNPILRFDNVLQQLTELRDTLDLLFPVSYKGHTQMEEMQRARFVGRGTELPAGSSITPS